MRTTAVPKIKGPYKSPKKLWRLAGKRKPKTEKIRIIAKKKDKNENILNLIDLRQWRHFLKDLKKRVPQ